MPRNNLGRHNINLRISNTLSSKFSTDAKITYINQFIDSKYSTGEGGPVMELFQIPRNVSIADAQNYEVINNVGVPYRSLPSHQSCLISESVLESQSL
ncbi:MAG: hypothetical protein IPI77_23570 [Saprospiraceae bacterium]|nr:hypothetical protein [Saprospiraceae bacterium]